MRSVLPFIGLVLMMPIATAQPIGAPIPTHNIPSISEKSSPDWGYVTKSAGDSCGFYFNNYVGLAKSSNVLQEYMRTGDIIDDYYYAGRAQRFSVTQPVEVGGVEFYAYELSPLDSVMVITTLHSYVALNDSLGPEITRDTCWVTHTAFTFVLPNIAVQSYFDTPITMSGDFVIAMHSTQNEELIIVTNDYTANDGAGESNSFALYLNPAYPADDGWYSGLNYLGADYDYLMSPYVKFDLYQPFTILDDTICPDVVNAGCVNYTQVPHFTNHMYNSEYSSSTTHNVWLWGDGYQNVDLTSACHTYANPGTFDINLRDTFFRYDFNDPHCVADVVQPIVALDAPVASFTFIQDGLSADFVNTSTNSDSVWWDFGDLSVGTDSDIPSHAYTTVGVFDVWMFAYNECYVDSTLQQVTTDDVGINEENGDLTVYPNPANQLVYINGLNSNDRIELYSILGEMVFQTSASESSTAINISELPSGAYFVKIIGANFTSTKEIIIRH